MIPSISSHSTFSSPYRRVNPPRFGDAPEYVEDGYNYVDSEPAVAPPPLEKPEEDESAKKAEIEKLRKKARLYKTLGILQLVIGFGSFPGALGVSVHEDSIRKTKPPELEFQTTANNFLNALGTSDPAQMSRIEQEALRSKVIRQFVQLQQRIITENPNVALQQLRTQLEIAIPAFSAAQIEGTDTIIAQANALLRSNPSTDQTLAIDTYLNSFNHWMETVGKEKYGLNAETVAFMQNQANQYRQRMTQVLTERQDAINFYDRLSMLLLLVSLPVFAISGLVTKSKANRLEREIRIKSHKPSDIWD